MKPRPSTVIYSVTAYHAAENPSVPKTVDATYVGTDLTVAFNPDYFAAGVEACIGDSITLSTLDALKPAVVRGVGIDDYLYLLMPVRVP